MFLPNIIEKTGKSEKVLDLPSKLLSDRIIYFGSDVDDTTANIAIMQLLWLSSQDPESDIDLYVNSPGGSVYAGLAIIDIINKIPNKVNTIGIGMCASMGAVILSAGTGIRRATENCRIMIHSVSSGTRGTVHDMNIDMKESIFLQNKLMKMLADNSKGKCSERKMNELCKRDKYLSSEESIKLGLIDEVI